MTRALLALSFCLHLHLVTAPARAQDSPPADYVELVEQAMVEIRAERWFEARALFRRAHAIYPNARSLRGIGMTAFEVRDYVDAAHHLRLALAETRRELDPEQRAQTESLLGRALAFVAVYETGHLPDGAEILVDGAPRERQPDGSVLVADGAHEVLVRFGGRVARATLHARGGERAPLPVVLPPPAPEGPAGTAVREDEAALAAPRRTPTAPEARGVPAGAVALGAGGGAVAVTGVVVLALGLAARNEVEQAPRFTEWSDVADEYDRAPGLLASGAGLLSAGLVAAGAGLAWALASDRGIEVAVGPGAVRLRGSF